MKTILLKIVVLIVFTFFSNSLFSQVYFINTQGDTLMEIKDHGTVIISDSLFVKIMQLDTLTVNDRLGIGISPPVDELHVSGDNYTFAQIEVNTDYDAGLHLTANSVQSETGGTNQYAILISGNDNSGDFRVNEDYVGGIWNPTPRFCLENETGFIGVGISNPTQNLHIHSTDGTNETALRITDNNSTANGGEVGIQGDQSLYLWNYENSYLLFGTNNTSRVWITNTGDVGIGTNTPKARLDVEGGMQIGNDSDAASADKVGTLRYRDAGFATYLEICMRTGASSYAWVIIHEEAI